MSQEFDHTLQHHLLDLTSALGVAERRLKIDLVLKLHTDGSGRLQDMASEEDVFVFERLQELQNWLGDTPAPKTPRHVRRHLSNACVGGFHQQCISGPGQPCHCGCHVGKGGDAA